MQPPILFVNIAWMKKYRGNKPSDQLEPGNFAYFKGKKNKKLEGHEQWNFLPTNGYVYGYTPLAEGKGVNLRRLGAPPGATEMTGVLIVFMARDPRAKLLKVVGFYEDATIRNDRYDLMHGSFKVRALFRTSAANARIVEPPRNLVIPTAQTSAGGVGQAPLWYGDARPDIVAKVRRFFANKQLTAAAQSAGSSTMGTRRQSDTEKRLAIERESMKLAMEAFNDTEDVSRLKRGWDVEARKGRGRIYIEVKGTSGSTPLFELTPNEYKQMNAKPDAYVLYVVTGCLSAAVRAHTFEHANGIWTSETGLTLDVEPLTGARCSAR